jgi:hypothetical protein
MDKHHVPLSQRAEGKVPEKYDGRGETRLVVVRTKKTSQLDERPSGEVTVKTQEDGDPQR